VGHTKKQQLIDSILRDWRLPKFYFVKNSEDEYEVVDGQQRLVAIYEFFANELALAPDSVIEFGGPYYKDLKPKYSDAFDDFEIDYDEVEEATEAQLKQFFQRLQEGIPLTMGKPIMDLAAYKALISDLYFVFRESIGPRLDEKIPASFVDVNVLRTDIQHDTDHGNEKKVKMKKTQAGSVFIKYSGVVSPDVLDPTRFALVQANILSAHELDLKNLVLPKT
jgi:Protein of unknown function DUF262